MTWIESVDLARRNAQKVCEALQGSRPFECFVHYATSTPRIDVEWKDREALFLAIGKDNWFWQRDSFASERHMEKLTRGCAFRIRPLPSFIQSEGDPVIWPDETEVNPTANV